MAGFCSQSVSGNLGYSFIATRTIARTAFLKSERPLIAHAPSNDTASWAASTIVSVGPMVGEPPPQACEPGRIAIKVGTVRLGDGHADLTDHAHGRCDIRAMFDLPDP
jgi:hypothetical protein